MSNEAMKVILGCPRNARVDIMGTELGLQSTEQRAKEVNLIVVIRS